MTKPAFPRKIIIGSRGSELALWQANYVLQELKKLNINAEIKIIKTQGDKIQNLSFDKLEGKGFFTKELEEALLNNEIDLAVHSHKDLPTTNPAGLTIGAVSYREDPSELLLINKDAVDERKKFSLKENAVVGTSSARRKSQLLAFRSDVQLRDLRGNVPTRIQKLKEKMYDAIMLASAGVERLCLELNDFYVVKLSPQEFVPAPAQGVLALQIRESDLLLKKALSAFNNPDVEKCIAVERKVLNLFDGGCQLPLGVYCVAEENEFEELYYKVWVSKAEQWNTMPLQAFYDSQIPDTLPEKIVDKLSGVKPTSVFISRNKKTPFDYFFDALQKNAFAVSGKSLIEIKRIQVKNIPAADWVFFSSKNAVKHFIGQKPDLKGKKFAVVGKATADELRKHGYRADFIGNSNDTRITAKQFVALAGSKKVLFPQAKGSIQSIQKQFIKKEQVINLIVYETIKNTETLIQDHAIYVFTSPSNVEGFLEKNKIPAEAKVVAMGNATSHALKKAGIRPHKHTPSFDDIGLVQSVISIS